MSEKYNECMEHIQVDADMRERLLRAAREKSQGTRRVTAQKGHRRVAPLSILRYSSVAAACLVLVAIGAIALHRGPSFHRIPSSTVISGSSITGVEQHASSYQTKQTEDTAEKMCLVTSITEEPVSQKVEMQEVGSLGELSDRVGFSVAELDLGEDSLPFSPSQVTYTSVNDQVAKVTYSAENATIILSKTEKIDLEKKTKPTNAPEESPFPDMLDSLTVASCTVDRDGTSVTLFGDGPLYSRATWDAGEYAYKLDVPEQAKEEQLLEMVDSIKHIESQTEGTPSTENVIYEDNSQDELPSEEAIPTPTVANEEPTSAPTHTPIPTQAAMIIVATPTPTQTQVQEPTKVPTPTQIPEPTSAPVTQEAQEPTAIPIPTATETPLPTEAVDFSQETEENGQENTQDQSQETEETTGGNGGSKLKTQQEQTDATNAEGFGGEESQQAENSEPTPQPTPGRTEQATETTTELPAETSDETHTEMPGKTPEQTPTQAPSEETTEASLEAPNQQMSEKENLDQDNNIPSEEVPSSLDNTEESRETQETPLESEEVPLEDSRDSQETPLESEEVPLEDSLLMDSKQ